MFLAEPVGSCTDLRATVQYPLRRLYGDDYRVAPLSVLVDPMRAARVLGLEAGRSFSPKVLYVYEKQLEEADIIVINKSDLLSAAQREALEQRVERPLSPGGRRDRQRADGREPRRLVRPPVRIRSRSRPAMDVDYDVYAEGEALLGWLNATCPRVGVEPVRRQPVPAAAGRRACATGWRAAGIEIAHFKMTLAPDTGNDLAVLNLVRTDGRAESPHRLAEELTDGELIVNLRAEGDPEQLEGDGARRRSSGVAREMGVTATVEHSRAFPAGPAGADAPDGDAMSESDASNPLLPLRVREGRAGRRQGGGARTACPKPTSSSTRCRTCARWRRAATRGCASSPPKGR